MDSFVKDTEENSASDDLQAVSVLSQYNRANLGQFVANAGRLHIAIKRATVLDFYCTPKNVSHVVFFANYVAFYNGAFEDRIA